MSESNISILTDVVQITCVVGYGKGEEAVKAARGAGAGGAIIYSGLGDLPAQGDTGRDIFKSNVLAFTLPFCLP